MKILFVVDDFAGGAGNVVQILANSFVQRSYEVDVLLLNHHTQHNFLRSEISVIKKNISLNSGENKFKWLVKNLQSIKKTVLARQPDTVISFLDNNNTLLGLSLLNNKTPLIVSERNNIHKIKPSLFWRLLRIPAYIRANKITVQFDNFKNMHFLYNKKVAVTPNPIIEPSIHKISTKFGEKIKIVTHARLIKRKRIDLMLYIFEKINKEFPGTVLYIYGEGAEKEQLLTIRKSLNLEEAVLFPGKTYQPHRDLADKDIYLMTSEQEGFPNSLSEALAIGLPTVVNKCHEGFSDLIQDKENAILIENNNMAHFISALRNLIIDEKLRNKLSNNARRSIKKYSLNNVTNLWEDLIIEVQGEKK